MKTSILLISSQSQRRTLPFMTYQIHFCQTVDLSIPLSNFFNFAKTYGFKLITWLPYYARGATGATGKGEAAVKEAGKMLKNRTSSLVSWTLGKLCHRV